MDCRNPFQYLVVSHLHFRDFHVDFFSDDNEPPRGYVDSFLRLPTILLISISPEVRLLTGPQDLSTVSGPSCSFL